MQTFWCTMVWRIMNPHELANFLARSVSMIHGSKHHSCISICLSIYLVRFTASDLCWTSQGSRGNLDRSVIFQTVNATYPLGPTSNWHLPLNERMAPSSSCLWGQLMAAANRRMWIRPVTFTTSSPCWFVGGVLRPSVNKAYFLHCL